MQVRNFVKIWSFTKAEKKAWFIKVVSALNEYEESLKKRFIKVVIKDFSEAVSVKI